MNKHTTIIAVIAALLAPSLAQTSPLDGTYAARHARLQRIKEREAEYAARPLKVIYADQRAYCGSGRVQAALSERAVSNARKLKRQLEQQGWRVEIREVPASAVVLPAGDLAAGRVPLLNNDRC